MTTERPCVWCKQTPCELGDEDACEQRFVYPLPPGPRCERCGHELCPCCPLPWCDLLIPEPGDVHSEGETYFVVEHSGLCCGGECAVAWDDYLEWNIECSAIEAMQPPHYSVVVVAEGPWLPAAVRRDRRLARWYPAQPFAASPRICSKLARVAVWQQNHGVIADGLIGPRTWAKRNPDLESIAAELARILDEEHETARAAGGVGFRDTQLRRFLSRVLPERA